jgi:hypothetical protein
VRTLSLLLASTLLACGDPPPPAPAPRPPAPKRPTKPKAKKPPANPLLLAEELRDADAFFFVETSKRTSLERGTGKYAEKMVLSMKPSKVVFAEPAIEVGEPIELHVPYREIMERLGGTPNTRKTGLSKPNAHPSLPMGWIVTRDGERWVVRAAVRGMSTERDGLAQLAEAARGDRAPAAVLQRMIALNTSGASGVGRAIGQMLAASLKDAPPDELAALAKPHAANAVASLKPGRWPDVHVFVLRHADETTRKFAVKTLLERYDAEVKSRPPPKKGQMSADGLLIDGSTCTVLEDLLNPGARSPLYPVDERTFKRINRMKPEILEAARAFVPKG